MFRKFLTFCLMTLFWQMYWMTCFFYCHINYFNFSHHFASDVSFGIIKHLLTRYLGHSKFNRFLHTFLGKTGWSSTSDRNFMSFREWSTAKRAKTQKFISLVEDHPGFPNNACKYMSNTVKYDLMYKIMRAVIYYNI